MLTELHQKSPYELLIKTGAEAAAIRKNERLERQKRMAIVQEKLAKFVTSTSLVDKNTRWSPKSVDTIKDFLIDVAPFVSPRVDQHYWSHLLLASIYAKNIAKIVNDSHIIGQSEGQAIMLLHDVGRLVIAHRYLQNDYIADIMLSNSKVREDFTNKMPPMKNILAFRKRFGNPIHSMNDMTYAVRIVDFSDNLGKMVGGELFTVEQTQSYSTKRLADYELYWPTEASGRRAMIENGKSELANSLVSEEANWLETHLKVDRNILRANVWQEFQNPKNQEWLRRVREAQTSGLTNISAVS